MPGETLILTSAVRDDDVRAMLGPVYLANFAMITFSSCTTAHNDEYSMYIYIYTYIIIIIITSIIITIIIFFAIIIIVVIIISIIMMTLIVRWV